MAINLTGLQDYVRLYPALLEKLTYRDSVLGLFQAHTGNDPGKVLIRIYDANANLSNCCTTPDDTDNVNEKEVEAICLQSRSEYCETDLAKLLNDGSIRYTAGNESAGKAEEIITDQRLAAVQIAIDRLVFQGDKDSLDSNLNKLDGLIKQATDATDSVKLNITQGNAYSAILQVILAIPAEAYDLGRVAIFVPKELESAYQAALISLNQFNYNPGVIVNDNVNRRQSFPGFGEIDIVGTRGLNGTNTIIATPYNNVHWLTSLEGDHTTMKWGYAEYHEKYYWYVKFILGITFGIDEYVVVATLDPSVITTPYSQSVTIQNDPLNVAVTAPLGANGGVLTDTTA